MATLETRLRSLAEAVAAQFNATKPRLTPPGGTAGQVLSKNSSTDNDFDWSNVAATTIGFQIIEANLGTPAKRSGTFLIAGLSGLTVGAPVKLWLAPGPYTGKGFTGADEVQLYEIDATGIVTAVDEIRVYWRSRYRVRGNVKFNYLIGA